MLMNVKNCAKLQSPNENIAILAQMNRQALTDGVVVESRAQLRALPFVVTRQ